MINSYTIPITLEQSIAPVALKYSLGTKFSVSNSLFESINPSFDSPNYDGYFRRGDNLYGTVSWQPELDTTNTEKSSSTKTRRNNNNNNLNYKLDIEKLYVCSTHNDLVPVYDPDGSAHGKGAQHGCTRPDKSIKHRILLLDRSSPSSSGPSDDVMDHPLIGKVKFEAKHFGEMFTSSANNRNFSKYLAATIVDGFKFNVDALFDIDNYTSTAESSSLSSTAKKDSVWFVQAVYSIRPVLKKRHLLLSDVYNNGTNIQIVRLSRRPSTAVTTLLNSRFKSKLDQSAKSALNRHNTKSTSTFVKLVMPLILAIIILVIFVTISIIYIYHSSLKSHRAAKSMGKPPVECFNARSLGRKFKRKRNAGGQSARNITSLPRSDPMIDPDLTTRPKVLTEDSNLTFQTSASTPVNSQEDFNGQNELFNRDLIHTHKSSRLRSLLKRFSSSSQMSRLKSAKIEQQQQTYYDEAEYDLARNFIESSHNSTNHQQRSRLSRLASSHTTSSSIQNHKASSSVNTNNNNYLYFNYNNNKMNFFSNAGSGTGGTATTGSSVVNAVSSVSTPTQHLMVQQQPVNTTTTTEIIINELVLGGVSQHNSGHSKKFPMVMQPHHHSEALAILSSISSSTPTQITPVSSSSTKCSANNVVLKRLSGTEV
jgi:hypothetical protein